MNDVFAIIMAGGSGTRFWPAGRRRIPKQLLSVTGGKTLIQSTVDRVPSWIPKDRILIVTNTAHTDGVAAQVDIDRSQIIGEPEGRDTAPCVGLAAHIVEKRCPGAVMIVMAADHLIRPPEKFHECLARAAAAAREYSAIVTIGLVPTFPAEGYGYVETGGETAPGILKVGSFKEKPKRETAELFMASGRHFWNAGIFAWKASTVLGELERQRPALASDLEIIARSIDTPQFAATMNEKYGGLEKISIDYAVLEGAPNRLCIPANFEWDDVGSLLALERHNPKDGAGNTILGRVHASSTKRTIVDNRAPGIVATLGVDDLIIVRTADAVLVARRADAEKVKKLVEELERGGNQDVL